MDRVIHLIRRFGFDYKRIPKDYIKDQILFLETTRQREGVIDPEYARLLTGYLMCIGDRGDGDFLSVFPIILEDKVISGWHRILCDGGDKSEGIKNFEERFDKYLRSYTAKELFETKLNRDIWFAVFAILIVISLGPLVFLYYSEAELDIPLGRDRFALCSIAVSLFWSGLLAFRLRYLIPVGFDRDRHTCLVWGSSFFFGSVCLISAVLISIYGSGLYYSASLATVLMITPVALFFFAGGILKLTGMKNKSLAKVTARVIEHADVVNFMARSYRPVFGYEYDGVEYRGLDEAGRSYSKKVIDSRFPVGGKAEITVDPYNPSKIITPGEDKAAVLLLFLAGFVTVAIAVVVFVFNVG